jgi:acetyl esterase/lipase
MLQWALFANQVSSMRVRLHSIFAYCLAVRVTLTLADPASAQPVTIDAGISFGSSGQKLDVCYPQAASKRVALLLVHGGGFRSGSRNDMLPFCRLYAEGGIVSATLDYRLSPANVFPAALTDVREALGWFASQAQRYSFDANKIVIVGYSAGANLALMTGLEGTPRVAAIISVAAPTDFRAMIEGPTFEQAKRDMRAYLGTQAPEAASPIHFVSQGDPPVFLFHGQNDTFVPVSHSLLLAQRLKQHNVPVLLRVFPDAGHEIMLPGSNFKQLLDEMTRFVGAVDAKR